MSASIAIGRLCKRRERDRNFRARANLESVAKLGSERFTRHLPALSVA